MRVKHTSICMDVIYTLIIAGILSDCYLDMEKGKENEGQLTFCVRKFSFKKTFSCLFCFEGSKCHYLRSY